MPPDTLTPREKISARVDNVHPVTFYDNRGNRILKNLDGQRTTSSYDAANQLAWSQDASGRTTYTFDADGNQQVVLSPSGDRVTNLWDYENKLVGVQHPAGSRETMAYDPDGKRVMLQESASTTKYVWDNQNYLQETQCLRRDAGDLHQRAQNLWQLDLAAESRCQPLLPVRRSRLDAAADRRQ